MGGEKQNDNYITMYHMNLINVSEVLNHSCCHFYSVFPVLVLMRRRINTLNLILLQQWEDNMDSSSLVPFSHRLDS